jgi:hypothetical protein
MLFETVNSLDTAHGVGLIEHTGVELIYWIVSLATVLVKIALKSRDRSAFLAIWRRRRILLDLRETDLGESGIGIYGWILICLKLLIIRRWIKSILCKINYLWLVKMLIVYRISIRINLIAAILFYLLFIILLPPSHHLFLLYLCIWFI